MAATRGGARIDRAEAIGARVESHRGRPGARRTPHHRLHDARTLQARQGAGHASDRHGDRITVRSVQPSPRSRSHLRRHGRVASMRRHRHRPVTRVVSLGTPPAFQIDGSAEASRHMHDDARLMSLTASPHVGRTSERGRQDIARRDGAAEAEAEGSRTSHPPR